MTDLERMEEVVRSGIGQEFDGECHLTEDEARQVLSLIAELKEAREALEPFARAGEHVEEAPGNPYRRYFDCGHLIRARAALSNGMGNTRGNKDE